MILFVITGDRESGKTTFCRSLYEAAEMRGCSIAGILTETERDVALTAFDLNSTEHRPLAVVRSVNDPVNPPGHPYSLETGRWIFDPETVEWGNRILSSTPASDLYILDEAGILEFEKGRGWTEGMKRIDHRRDGCSVCVVRPELVDRAVLRWPEGEVIHLSRPDEELMKNLILKILGTF